MASIQTDVSDSALITAIRANMYAFLRHVGRTDPANYFENEKFARLYTPIPHPMFNLVICSNRPADGDEAFIEESIQYFHAMHSPSFMWWMEPHLKRSDWEPILTKHKFEFSDDTPGMALDLQTLNESGSTVDGFEIQVVEDGSTLKTWTHVFTLGYGLPNNWEHLIFDLWARLGFDFPIRNYLGLWQGQPVATSCLFFGAGVAGIYNVATLPEARGHGIGAALTLEPLREARTEGYRVATLQSSEMGYPVYKKLGFRHLCQMENFYRALDR